MKYDFGNMSAQNLRDLAGDFNAAANIADQITKIFGKDVRIDGTSSPTLGLPIFSAMKQAVRDADGLDLVLNELEVFIDKRDDVAPPAEPAPVPAASVHPSAPDSLTYDERELYRYLIDLTAAGPMPNFDVPMIEAVGRGIALDAFSASSGLPHGIVTQRFNKLVAPLRNNCGQLPTHAMGCILKILKMIKGAA